MQRSCLLIPAALVVVLGLFSVHYTAPDANQPEIHYQPQIRVAMVTNTRNSEYGLRFAKEVDDSIRKRMGSDDRIFHVIEADWASRASNILENVVPFPPVLLGVNLTDAPTRPLGYRRAQVKFYYGLVGAWRQLKGQGAAMPKWWLIRDDDTYVHLPNLMKNIDVMEDGVPLWTKEVAFGNKWGGCLDICGGSGFLLSGALVDDLVPNHGDHLLSYVMNQVFNGTKPWYSGHVKYVAGLSGVVIKHAPFMNVYSPNDPKICNTGIKWACVDGSAWYPNRPNCMCGEDQKMAPSTWHLRGPATKDNVTWQFMDLFP